MGRRRRKAKRTDGILVLLFIILSVIFAAVLVFMLALGAGSAEKKPVYRTISLGEEAAARAYLWLNQTEDMPLSYTDIRRMMGKIPLTVIVTSGDEEGEYTCALAEGSLEDCNALALAGLEKAYREVIRYRLHAAGYEEDISDEKLDLLMQEAYGISLSEYLLSCNLQLLPTRKELEESYLREAAYE